MLAKQKKRCSKRNHITETNKIKLSGFFQTRGYLPRPADRKAIFADILKI